MTAAATAFAGVAVSPLGAVHAAPDALVQVAGVGFEGRARMGAWTPVWIDVLAPPSGLDGLVRIEAPASAGRPVMVFASPVRAAPGARVRVFVPSIFFESRAPGVVSLDDARGRLATMPLPRLRAADDIVAVLSAEPLGVEAAVSRAARTEVAHLAAEALPRVWQACEGVRLLAIRDLDERRIDDAQRRAIRDWIIAGGRLLVMPAGDDRRQLSGPTLQPILMLVRGGRVGRGQVVIWNDDAANPLRRGTPEDVQAWARVLADGIPQPPSGLEATLAPGRPIPLRIHTIIAVFAALYLIAIRRLSRWLARARPAAMLASLLVVAVATWAGASLGAAARHEASGVVASVVVEGLPGAEHGLVRAAARTVSSAAGAFQVATTSQMLLRPDPPASAVIIHDEQTVVRSEGSVQLTGAAVVPMTVAGSYGARGGTPMLTVANRSGQQIDPAWLYASGRVQRLPPIGDAARLPIDEQKWQPVDRLQRTEPNHALLQWAFSHLDGDVILKATPAWLVGWTRNPSLALRWNGRTEAPLVLVLVPLTAP